MSRSSVTIILSSLLFIATSTLFFQNFAKATSQAPTCESFLRGKNSYDELDPATKKVVQKISVFELTEWSKHSAYEEIWGTNLTPESSILHIEIRNKIKGPARKVTFAKFSEVKSNPTYKAAKFRPLDWIGKAPEPGVLTFRLENNSTTLCEQSFALTEGD